MQTTFTRVELSGKKVDDCELSDAVFEHYAWRDPVWECKGERECTVPFQSYSVWKLVKLKVHVDDRLR